METIETLSQEYSQKVGLDENEEFIYLQGLKAGVEFAQKWISVDDELPEIDSDDCWNHTHGFSKTVITTNSDLNFPNYKTQSYNRKSSSWQYKNKVTHWRPINLK